MNNVISNKMAYGTKQSECWELLSFEFLDNDKY